MSKLLVIDDEPTILHSFRRAFRERNVTLLTAGTAAEGIKLVAQQRPDVVILDVQLPDLSRPRSIRQDSCDRFQDSGNFHYRPTARPRPR